VLRLGILCAALAASLPLALPQPARADAAAGCRGAAPATPAAVACAARSTLGRRAALIARSQLGRPYVWGGTTPAGFDCSGLTRWIYAHLGVALPHSSYAQWGSGRRVSGPPQPGDLVFFAGLSHVGIAIGGGRFVHAPGSGASVRIDAIGAGWYRATYDGAVRVAAPQPLVPFVLRRAWRGPLATLSRLR
jgi:cell wall-associated NlpC family hydrolase